MGIAVHQSSGTGSLTERGPAPAGCRSRGHINGDDLLLNVAAAGDANTLTFRYGNGGDITQ